ncbi:hypothetical protein KIPB_013243, partial [Kipferlia bialata]
TLKTMNFTPKEKLPMDKFHRAHACVAGLYRGK